MRLFRDSLIVGLFTYFPISLGLGAIVGAVLGLASASWLVFWLITGAVFLVFTMCLGFATANSGNNTGITGNGLHNPHPSGSTEWYVHENERRKYENGKKL